jgi:hypothetical protein
MQRLTIIAAISVVILPLAGCGCCDWLHRGDSCCAPSYAPACCPQPTCCPDPCGYPTTGGCSNCAPGGTIIDGGTTPIPQTLPGDTYIGPATRPGPGGA